MNRFAPKPAPSPNIRYPDIRSVDLDNGITVICVSDTYLPRSSVRAVFPLGRVHDPENLPGRLQITSDMLKEGTEHYSSQELAAYLDLTAMELDQEIGTEHSWVSVSALENRLEEAAALLSELLRCPTFPEEELEKVKIRWKGHLISQRSDPGFLANERLLKELFGNHPYSRAGLTPEQLDLILREDLSEEMTRLQKQLRYLLFTGSVDIDRAVKLADSHFRDLSFGSGEITSNHSRIPSRERSVVLVSRPHSAQTRVVVGIRTIPRADRLYLRLKLANQLLGGSASSRLFLNLREDKGYTYGAYSVLRGFRRSGLLTASADVNTDATGPAIEEILREVEHLSTRPLEEEEIRKSRAELAGSFIRRTETPASVGSLEINRRLLDLEEDFCQTYIPRLQEISPQQVREVAEQLLAAHRMSIVAVSDREAVENDLRAFGDLKIYDSGGKRLE